MQFGPVESKTKGAARQMSGHQLQILNVDLRFVSLVERVKMSRFVVSVVHANDDAIESADCRHVGCSGLRGRRKLGEQRLRSREVGQLEAFGKPAINRREQVAGLVGLALSLP